MRGIRFNSIRLVKAPHNHALHLTARCADRR